MTPPEPAPAGPTLDDLPPNPYDEAMGHRVTSIGPDHCSMQTETGTAFHNPMGTTHGGLLAGLMDSSMGFLVSSNNPGTICTNVDLQISFVRARRKGTLTAKAEVLKRGRRAWLLRSQVSDEDGKLVAEARSTFLILQPEAPHDQ